MRIFFILFTLLLAYSCKSGNEARIEGRFRGVSDQKIYLEQIVVGGRNRVDSTMSNADGDFRFRIKDLPNFPSLYGIQYGNEGEKQPIILLVNSGENIHIESVGNIYNNYTVTGSEGSELIKEITMSTINTVRSMDSLFHLQQKASTKIEREDLEKESINLAIQHKRDHIKFVIKNASSLSSIVALYQIMPDGVMVFNDPADVIYFKTVSDSLSHKYPHSPLVQTLVKDVEKFNQIISQIENVSDLMDKAKNSEVNYPDISLPDSEGKQVKLSDIKDKIILLDFYMSTPNQKFNNQDMKDIYSEYKDKGFEIYQVSLDEDKLGWLNSITEQQIPWITVCDFSGTKCYAVGLYNIQKLPSNFLIDKKGNIIGQNLYGTALKENLSRLLD